MKELEDEFLDDYDVKEIEETTNELAKGFNWDRLTRVIVSLRWAFNTMFIGFPWMVISVLLVVYNIVFNAWLNRWWGYGNLWLIANTYFAICQAVFSWPLFFEFGVYLRHFYLIRWTSLFLAIVYNIVYLSVLVSWLIETYALPSDKVDEIGTLDILLDMFFLYNTILHASIIPLNFGIIFKEIEMEFFELMQRAGGHESAYNLSFEKAKEGLSKSIWFLSPISLTERIWKKVFKYDINNIWTLNPDDPSHYIFNVIKL